MLDPGTLSFETIEYEGLSFVNFWTPEWTAQKLTLNRDAAYSQSRRTLIAIRELERYIALSPNLSGWMVWVAHQYPLVKRIIERLGGREIERTFHKVWYVKFKKDFDHVW